MAWAIDASSAKGVPNSNVEWTDARVAAGFPSNPVHLWLSQEAAGGLADSIMGGITGNSPLAAFNSPTYQQVVPGWTRRAVGLDDLSDAFFSTTIGDVSARSYMILAYARVTSAPSGAQSVFNLSTGTASRQAGVNTTPLWQARGSGVTTVTGTGAATSVRPVVILVNRAAGIFSVMTDQDKLTTNWIAPAGGTEYFSLEACDKVQMLYCAMWEGAGAEVTEVQVGRLLQTLGWTVPWLPTTTEPASLGGIMTVLLLAQPASRRQRQMVYGKGLRIPRKR